MWRRRRLRIDSHDARSFPRARRRTLFVHGLLAAVAIALLVVAVASARDLDTRERGILPTGTVGVVVLDLSLSITDTDYVAVRRALRELAADDARIGLVVFSDVAYELLPPGAPSKELRSLLRLLVRRGSRAPVNPWTQSFRAGTRVSSALELAREMIERDDVENPSIFLVSDLETAPEDVPVLARTVQSLRASDIDLRVAALNPSSEALQIFEGLVEAGSLVLAADLGREPPTRVVSLDRVPTALALTGSLLFLALAVLERFTGRLGLPDRRGKVS